MTTYDVFMYGWPYVSIALAIPATVWIIMSYVQTKDTRLLLGLVLPMYWFHQFEEHGIDLYGNKYNFINYFCGGLFPDGNCVGDEVFLFSVNVVACNVAGLTAVLLAKKRPVVAACQWGIPLVNLFGHVVPALKNGVYNPGLLTSVLLFGPVTILVIAVNVQQKVFRPMVFLPVWISGVLVHILMLISVFSRADGKLPYNAFIVINGLLGFVPYVIGSLAESHVGMTTTEGEKKEL